MQTENITNIDICEKNRQDFSPNIEDAINKIVKREGFIQHTIYKREVSTNGGNFMGDLYEIDIKGKTVDGKKEVNLFIKKFKENAKENIPADVSISTVYENEVFAYNELSSVFKELQDEGNVPEDFRYKIAKGYPESFVEAIILENLARKGYKTGHRMDLVSYKFAKLAIEQLAKFHGLSFALERLRPKYFEERIKTIEYPCGWFDSFHPFVNNTISNIENIDVKRKMSEYSRHVVPKFKEFFDVTKAPIRALVHGDYRYNNILFKEIDGEVIDIIPVDYQALHYGCPVNDFLFFIHLDTDLEFRKTYFEELKDIYYNTMKVFLQYFGIEVEDVLPRELLENAFKSRREYGVMMALAFSGFRYVDDGDVVDFGTQKLDDWKPTLVPYFQTRIKEVCDEYFTSE